ncbi:hypothetical protein M2323_002930 [Rhodoblastus acidophilus]|uniref:hypothetical protein n=1 Tax=Rhodoblastus acidophilus TaxID=1074 RepID=UPI002224022A|nr:hypothetical protein [Rhodoblastus acidophilus]MCW2284943.1 hypothetical protein [Rhodoblastus acidophilus]MCW2333993.1 hypothetical protein [Rhodoblastus acidophilus]
MQIEDEKKRKRHSNPIPVEVRLKVGRLSVDEVRALKDVGRTTFYEDVKAGRVILEKDGRRSSVRGPIAALYIAGLPMPSTTEAAAA